MFPWYMRRKPKKKKDDGEQTPKAKRTGGRREADPVKKLDKVFSAYIRLRDTMPSGNFRCISCGHIFRFEEGDCGHFHSRGHMATRWEPDNAHMECRGCNRASADHLIKYRRNLIEKIGLDRVATLEKLADSTKHWMQYELQEKIDYFTREVKRLSAEKGIKVKI